MKQSLNKQENFEKYKYLPIYENIKDNKSIKEIKNLEIDNKKFDY